MHKLKSSRLRKAYKIYSKILIVFNFITNKTTISYSMRTWTTTIWCVNPNPYEQAIDE